MVSYCFVDDYCFWVYFCVYGYFSLFVDVLRFGCCGGVGGGGDVGGVTKGSRSRSQNITPLLGV